jgi:hypothetical protein
LNICDDGSDDNTDDNRLRRNRRGMKDERVKNKTVKEKRNVDNGGRKGENEGAE